MPQWEAELSDGRTVVLEADSEPTEEAILGGLQDYETAQSKTSFKDLSADQPLKLARPRMDVGFPTTAGGPRVPIASLAETLAEPKEEMEPRIQLPEAKVTEQDSPLSVVGKEAWNLAKGIPEFFSSTPGLLAAFAGPGAPALTSALFAGQMFTDLGQQLVSTYKDWDQLSRNQKIKAVVDMVGTGAMGGLLAKHTTSAALDSAIPARALAKQIREAPLEPRAEIAIPPIVQDLRPAVKTMAGEVVEGDKGQTHNEIIKEEQIPATSVDRREFVDTKTGQEVSREQVATAIPTERPGEAHSTDLTEAQKAEEQARLAAELGQEPAPPETKAPTPSDVPAEQRRIELNQLGLTDADISDLESGRASVPDVVARKLPGEPGRGPDHAKALEEARVQAVQQIESILSKYEPVSGRRKAEIIPVPLPGPGAQTAGEPKYAAIQQLTDQLNAAKPVGARERLSVREKLADAWAQGKSLVDRAVGRSRAVSQTVKEMARGVRDVADLDRQVGTLDYLLQRSAGQSIENGKAIKRQMRNKPMREAVALWIDANGDTAAIRDTLSNLKPGIRPNVRRALEAAANLSPEAREFAESLKQFFGIREQDAIASDVFERGLEDYFTHIWQKETNMPDSMRAAVSNGRVNDYFQFARQRKLSTFLEGINQGKNPILDPARVVPYYNYALDRAIASRQFIKALSDLDAPDGRPAVLPSGTAARMGSAEDPTGMAINPRGKTELGRDYRTIDHPALRKWKWIGKDENGNPIMYRSDLAVNPAMYERLARMLDRGRMTPTEWGRRALRASTEVKGMKLGLLSAFHQVHVGSHALWHWTNPFDTKPIDWDSPGARFAIEQGHLKIAADPGQLAEMSEGILGGGSTLVQKIPVLGPWARAYSEWLFGDYIPRLKLKTFENAYDRNLKWYAKDIASGKETPETIAARVGDSVNNAYGELNHWFLGKYGRDPRFQRLLRGIFLAPDFGEARLRFVEKAFTKLGNEERLALATMFVTMYMASRVGNWLSHGDPEWEAKNMFRVKVGDHWISARSVVGDVAHALTNASQFMYVRLNPLYARTASDLLFRRDLNGRKLAWTDVLLERPAEQLIPIQFSNLTRDDQNLWESFISSMGLQSRHDTPQGDVRQMVRKFMAASNDPKLKERADRLDQEIFAPSVYAKLRTALLADNKEKAQAEFGKLLKTRSRDQIFKAMDQSRHPYSGSWEVESAFLGSLKPKEREAYARARAEQAAIYQRFLQIASLPEK